MNKNQPSKLVRIAVIVAIVAAVLFVLRNTIIEALIGIASIFVDLFVITNFYLFFTIVAFVSVLGLVFVFWALRRQK
jgi:hypothetical protein